MSDMSDARGSGQIHSIAESLRDQAILEDEDLAEQLQRCADLCEDYAFALSRTAAFD